MYAYCELHIMLMVLKHKPHIARTLDMTCYRKIRVRRYLGKPTLKILFDVKFQKEHCIFKWTNCLSRPKISVHLWNKLL